MSICFYTAVWTKWFHKNVSRTPWHLSVIHMIAAVCRCQHKPSVWLLEAGSSLQQLFLLAHQQEVKTWIALTGILSFYEKQKHRKTDRDAQYAVFKLQSRSAEMKVDLDLAEATGSKTDPGLGSLCFLNNHSADLDISPHCPRCQPWLWSDVCELNI